MIRDERQIKSKKMSKGKNTLIVVGVVIAVIIFFIILSTVIFGLMAS